MNEVLKALAHPTRRRVLAMLKRGPLASGQIAEAFDVAWPTMTTHLNALRAAGLVTAERNGTSIRYRLNASVMEETAAALLDLAGAGRKQERKKP